MTGALRDLALMLLFCAAAGLIYYFLLPSGKLSQTAKSVLSVFFLLCVLSPLFSFLGQELPDFGAAQSEAGTAYDDVFIEAAKKTALREIGAVIEAYTDIAYQIELDVHISGASDIEIKQVRVTFDAAPADSGALEQALTDLIGTAPVITAREDE